MNTRTSYTRAHTYSHAHVHTYTHTHTHTRTHTRTHTHTHTHTHKHTHTHTDTHTHRHTHTHTHTYTHTRPHAHMPLHTRHCTTLHVHAGTCALCQFKGRTLCHRPVRFIRLLTIKPQPDQHQQHSFRTLGASSGSTSKWSHNLQRCITGRPEQGAYYGSRRS